MLLIIWKQEHAPMNTKTPRELILDSDVQLRIWVVHQAQNFNN